MLKSLTLQRNCSHSAEWLCLAENIRLESDTPTVPPVNPFVGNLQGKLRISCLITTYSTHSCELNTPPVVLLKSPFGRNIYEHCVQQWVLFLLHYCFWCIFFLSIALYGQRHVSRLNAHIYSLRYVLAGVAYGNEFV